MLDLEIRTVTTVHWRAGQA